MSWLPCGLPSMRPSNGILTPRCSVRPMTSPDACAPAPASPSGTCRRHLCVPPLSERGSAAAQARPAGAEAPVGTSLRAAAAGQLCQPLRCALRAALPEPQHHREWNAWLQAPPNMYWLLRCDCLPTEAPLIFARLRSPTWTTAFLSPPATSCANACARFGGTRATGDPACSPPRAAGVSVTSR